MHHLAHKFIRNFIWMKPAGRKTALADVSILASQLLETMTIVLLLPFLIRMLMDDWMSLNHVIFWYFMFSFCHVAVCSSLCSFVILKIIYIFNFAKVMEITDEVLMVIIKCFVFGISFLYPASLLLYKVKHDMKKERQSYCLVLSISSF